MVLTSFSKWVLNVIQCPDSSNQLVGQTSPEVSLWYQGVLQLQVWSKEPSAMAAVAFFQGQIPYLGFRASQELLRRDFSGWASSVMIFQRVGYSEETEGCDQVISRYISTIYDILPTFWP